MRALLTPNHSNRLSTALSLAVVGVFALALAAVFALLMSLLVPTSSEAIGVQADMAATLGAKEQPQPGTAAPAPPVRGG